MNNSHDDHIDNKKASHAGKKTISLSGGIQLAIFFIIIIVGAVFFLFIYNLLNPDQQKWYAALSLAYFIPPAGKETVILVGLNRGLPILLWCSTLWVYDVLVCIAIMTNWWFLELFIKHIPPFPFVGVRRKKPHFYKTIVSLKSWYEKLQRKTREIEMRNYGKLLLIVLAFFMFIPFQGTGAMSTTIIGTTLGLRKRTILFVVTVGSILSILLLSFIYIGIIRP
ncbi:MAG TPA: small multi-drug export protein [Candidatus Thermoplasmatota archaeon]|nr:small multi-drug export protein [Candidatus Thermoplasmatota archaeon]